MILQEEAWKPVRYKTRHQESPSVKHTDEHKHCISVKDVAVLNRVNDLPLRNLLETAFIKKLPNMTVCKSCIEIKSIDNI